jgi:diacylglycerol kinase family enzyme
MNMLPGALYGDRDWQTALDAILSDGRIRSVSGGTVDGHAFYVAAILGSPALWARAREAARSGRLRVAFQRAQLALGRAFSGRLRFTLDGARRQKAEALTLMCPLVSRGLDDDAPGLEAAALDPAGALDVFRLAFAAAAGSWRHDQAVAVSLCQRAYIWAGGPIPAILDGEPIQLGRTAMACFNPEAFRALVPADRESP